MGLSELSTDKKKLLGYLLATLICEQCKGKDTCFLKAFLKSLSLKLEMEPRHFHFT